MPAPTSERARWALGVLAGALLLAALHALWLATHRRGYPLETDESGYITIALRDHAALSARGLGGFWDTVQSQTPNAPLVPALTALLYTMHTGILISYGVLLAFLVLLVVSVYGIGERLLGPRGGALAALVAATSPGAIKFSREYVFALPAAALLAAAVYALMRSEGLRRRGWALAAGVSIGLMVLARTVTVAFLPGLLLAAVLALFGTGSRGRARAGVNLALAGVAATAVAASWYWRNIGPVSDYLTGFGYGRQSNVYGESHGLFSWDRWTAVADRMTGDSLYFLLAVSVTAGFIALAATASRRVLRSPRRRAAGADLMRSDAVIPAVVLLVGYLALSSSRNPGFGFTVPLIGLTVVLALLGLASLPPRLGRPVVAVLAAVAAFNLVTTSDFSAALAKRRDVSLAGFTAPLIDGQPPVVGALRAQVPGPQLGFEPRERRWLLFDRDLAHYILEYAGSRGRGPVVAFASRHRLLNTNSVGLAAILWWGKDIPFAQLSGGPGADTPAAYANYLSAPEHGQPNMLLTTNDTQDDFAPVVTQSYAEQAARGLGFHLIRTATQPDGRELKMWWLDR